MLTLMLGTVVLAITYGAFWHNQRARRQNDERGDDDFRFGRLVNHALELERKGRVFLAGKGVIPAKQTEFFRPVLRALRGFNPSRRILVDRAAVESSIPADLFKSKANRDELVAVRTT
jgi:hypothetical protein